ncbi:hypothetical protein BH09MYX1_BH09MYX1_28320 [soil metagenome]
MVNGGDGLTVDYAKTGYIPVQRHVETRWHDWSIIDDAILMPEGAVLPATVPVNDSVYHFVTGPKTLTDGDPERTPVLIIPDHTTVNGWAPASGAPFAFRMREFTVGANGPAAMPGSLPPQSAYTYAIDLEVDGAPSPTTFNHPVIFYVDNFNGTQLDALNGPGEWRFRAGITTGPRGLGKGRRRGVSSASSTSSVARQCSHSTAPTLSQTVGPTASPWLNGSSCTKPIPPSTKPILPSTQRVSGAFD